MRIVMKDVSKKIRGRWVLQHVDVILESGKIYGLRGYNGSGKTMLLRAICGLIQPTEGEIYIDDKKLGKDMDYPESVGIMIENPAFLGEFSGLKNLQMISELKNEAKERDVVEVLKKVGLEDAVDIKYKKYSLGMKQRLGIAAAIMEKPKILLLDEPTNALDPDGIRMVSEVITAMKGENRIIVIACHEASFLEEVADDVFEIQNGTII